MKNFLAFIKKIALYAFDRPILLGLLTLLAVAFIYQGSFQYGCHVSKDVFCLDTLNNRSISITSNPTWENQHTINPKIYSRLKDQFKYANDKKQFHLYIANYFNIHYYAMTLTLTICCIFSGLLIFLITKNGWEKTEKHVFTLFLVFGASTIYFGSCPAVFKVDDNIAQNEAFFKSYCNIENRIQTFIVSTDTIKEPCQIVSPKDTSKSQRTINYFAVELLKENDLEFNNLNRISIGMDISKVKSASEAAKTFNDATGNNTNNKPGQ